MSEEDKEQVGKKRPTIAELVKRIIHGDIITSVKATNELVERSKEKRNKNKGDEKNK